MRMFAYYQSRISISRVPNKTSQNIQWIRCDQCASAGCPEVTMGVHPGLPRPFATAMLDKLQTIWGCPVHVSSQEPQSPRHDAFVAVPCTSSSG